MNDTLRAAAFLDKGGTGKTTTVAHLGVARRVRSPEAKTV